MSNSKITVVATIVATLSLSSCASLSGDFKNSLLGPSGSRMMDNAIDGIMKHSNFLGAFASGGIGVGAGIANLLVYGLLGIIEGHSDEKKEASLNKIPAISPNKTSSNCQEVTQRLIIDNKPKIITRIACLQPNGIWRIVE